MIVDVQSPLGANLTELGRSHPRQIARRNALINKEKSSFFSTKIKKIRDTFSPSGTVNEVHPPSDPPKITVFRQVSEYAVDKIIKTSPSESCLLDPWPTFLIKECIDILLPSLTKLVNCSLMEGCVPDAFKTAVVTPLIKKANLPSDGLKNYHPVSGLRFI